MTMGAQLRCCVTRKSSVCPSTRRRATAKRELPGGASRFEVGKVDACTQNGNRLSEGREWTLLPVAPLMIGRDGRFFSSFSSLQGWVRCGRAAGRQVCVLLSELAGDAGRK